MSNAAAIYTDDEMIQKIIMTESSGNPNAKSPVGAEGLMQILEATARQPGYGVTPFQGDDLTDPEENVRFGSEYFYALADHYGSLKLAAIAYNMGPGKTNKWIENGSNIEELPKETQGYIKKLGLEDEEEILVAEEPPAPTPATVTRGLESDFYKADIARMFASPTPQTVPDLTDLERPMSVLTTKRELAGAGAGAGAYNLAANVHYFSAAWDALTGDEYELQKNLQHAQFLEEIGAEYMTGLPTFEDALENPTVGGFLDQTFIAAGEFFPSMLASVTAATIGSIVAILAGLSLPVSATTALGGVALTGTAATATRVGLSKTATHTLRKILMRAWKNKRNDLIDKKDAFDKIPHESLSLMKKVLGKPGIRRRFAAGGIAGAYAQENVQGTGVIFGEFARQGMTGRREAAISMAAGHPYAAVGVGAELVTLHAIMQPVMKIAKKWATGTGVDAATAAGARALLNDLSLIGFNVGVGFARGGIAEGSAEGVQEAMSVAQRFAIDDDYTGDMAKMDLLEATFKGWAGGGVFGGAGRGTASSVERITSRARGYLNYRGEKKAKEQRKATGDFKQQGLKGIFSDFDVTLGHPLSSANQRRVKKILSDIDAVVAPLVGREPWGAHGTAKKFPNIDILRGRGQSDLFSGTAGILGVLEPISDLRAQIAAMFDSKIGKDTVFFDKDQTIPTQKEMDAIFQKKEVHVAFIEGIGTLLSINKEKAESYRKDSSKENRARLLGRRRADTAVDDAIFQVRWPGKGIIHTEPTSQAEVKATKEWLQKKYQHGVETLGIKIEGPFSKESVVEDNLERVNSKPNLEDETNTRIQNAKDRLRAAKTSEEITRVFGSFSKDYFVLKALYDQFMAEVVPSAPGKRFLDFKKAIEDHLTKLLIPIREQLMVTLESQGIPVDDLVLTDPRVLAEVKRVLMAEEALEAKQTPKESISGRAAAETELAAIAVTEEQKAAAAEGEFVDVVDEAELTDVTEKLEKDNFIEVLNVKDRPWQPLNSKKADMVEWQGIKDKVFEKLSITEKVQFREVVQQNGGKRPDTFILKRLLELFELHEDKGIVYQLATSPIVVLDKALKVKKQQERLGNKIKNQILEEDIVRRFKEEGRDRRRIEVKEAYVEELNKLKNDHADTDFTRFIELFPGLAQHFGYAKEQVGYVIKYFPSRELDQVIFDPQDMYTQAEKEKRAKEKKPVLKPRLMTKKEYLKKIIQKGKVSGKGEKAESMRRNSFFTIVTPEGRRKAIQKANEVRKFVKDKGGMRAIAIEDFKKDKKDRRKRKVKKAFDLHLEDLNNRYENKLNEAYRKQEIPFDVTIVGTMASKLLGTYIEGNKNFRFENLRNLFTLAADHGYEFRARPNNPYYTNWIKDMPFTKTAHLLTAGKKTSTSRTSIHGAKGDIIASEGVKGLYILTKTPYRKSAKSIVKTDFKKEGFDSPRALLDVFEELGYLKEDFGNEHINEFMTGYRGAPKYQRYVLELEMQGYTDKEIAARNREIREAHLDRLNKTFPQLMVLQEVAITEMGAAAVAVGARKKVPDRATRPRLLKNNSTVWLAPERKKAIKKQLGANFSRIMVGNHGAYFEFNSKPKIPLIKEATRQHYNHWETKRGAKFYEQTATVNYADYKVGKWYVSVNDLQTGKKVEFKKEYQDRDLYVHEFRKLNAKEEAQYSKQSKLLPSKALSDFTMDEFDNSKAAISVAEGGAIKYTFGQLFQREIKTSFWNAKANTTYHMDAMIDSLPLVPLEKEQAIAVKTVLNEEFQEAGLAANMAPYERIVDKVKEKRLRVNFYRRIKDQVNEFLDNNFPEVSERLQAIKDTITKEGKAIKPTKIISGGQIGVDFAMLEAATESGIETGGMAPLGYRSEAQDKAAHMDKLKGYGLTESESANYMDRTRENVDNSAGTIVFTELDGLGDAKWDTAVGTNKTVEYAKEQGKPVLINPKTPEHIWLWMASNGLEGGIINMAGPRVMAPERIQDIKFIVTSAFKVEDVLPQYDKGDEYDAVTSFVELLQDPSNKNYYLTPSNEFVWATNDRDKFSMGVLYDEIHNALFYVAQHEYDLDLTSRHINEVYEGDSQGTFGEEEVQEAQAQDALEAWKIPGINDDQWQSHQRKIISEHGGSSLINSYRATPVNWTESELVEKPAIKKRPKVRKSSSFERVLGKYANPLINILNKFDYFGITADITFLTYDDINPDWNNSEKSKDEVLRKMKANKLRSENLDILWKERAAIKKAEGAFPRGTTFKTKGGKEYIVVIDTHAISRQPFGFESIGDVLALNRVQKKLLGKAQILITIAHELGHVVALNKLDEIHKKPGLKAKIMKDFEEAKPTNARYQGKNGFEEWYADQYASWLIAYARDGRHRAATTGTDSFFKNLAKKIIQVWSQLSEGMAEVFAGFKGKNKFKKSAAFAEWATELTKQFKGTVDFEFSRGHLNFEQKSMIYHMVEKNLEAEKQGFGLPKPIWKKVKEQTAKVQEKLILQAERNPDIKSFFARTFFTASGYLEGKKAAPVPKTNKEGEILLDDLGKPIFEEEREEVGKKIVRRLYQESRTSREAGELQPYVDAINQKFHQITSQIAKILGIDEVKLLWNTLNEEQNKAILYAEDDRLSDEELKSRSRIGWELRKLLRDFYTEYLLQEDENGNLYLDIDFYQTILRTPQGKKIVSYFPRSLNVYEILGNDELRASFIDLIVQKLDAGQLLTAVLDPETREKKTVLAVPKEGQTSHEWAVEFLNNVLELDTKELAAEGLEAASIGLSDPSSVELGMPSSLTRSLGFKVRQAVDEEGNLLVDKEGNPIYREYGFSTSELRDLGLIKDGFPALLDYFREGIKRMEYEQKVGGHIWVESMIKKLPKSDQPLARDAVRAILGKVRGPMDPLARKMNSWGLTSVIFTTLTFTVFASFPDLAGPFLRSNEFSSFLTGAESLRHYFNNKQEAIQFAIDIGAVTMDTLSSMYINAAEMDYMTPGSKKATDFFFKAIMLDQFTRFTRVFAAQMGKQFLLNLARSTDTSGRAQRNMVELHGDLTKEKILAWEESGFDFSTPEGKIMSEAIYTFVNESIIRPNAAQRPIWASNPYFALVWQLKGFFYAYGKTIVGGQYREMKNRYKEAGIQGAAVPLSMMALMVLPLTLLGLELREWTKWGLAGVLPFAERDDKYFRTDNMDWGTWLFELFDRSGMAGAFGILFPLLPGQHFGGPYETGADILGPAFGKGFDLYKHGPFDWAFWKEQIPVYYEIK